MKTLHWYVLKQAIATLAMTVCVFAFILLLGNVLRDIVALLVNRQTSPLLIIKALALLLPWIMAWVLPIALLTAMILLFGRLSADNELTAVKASGISLLALSTPLLVLALAVSGLCAWFNLKVTPESRVAYKKLLFQVTRQSVESLITEDRFIEEIPGVVLTVRKREGNELKDITIYQLESTDPKARVTTRTSAAKAVLTWDQAANKVTFELIDGITERREMEDLEIREGAPALLATNFLSTNLLQTMISNAAPGRIIGKTSREKWHPWQFGSTTFTLDLPSFDRNERSTKISEMTFWQLKEEIARRRAQGIPASQALVQMHRQVAFSFASFAFTLVAIPLGIRAHRRETSIGMAISLVLVMVYYSFLIVSESLRARAQLNPHLIVWIPNLLFQTLGIGLLWRANRKG